MLPTTTAFSSKVSFIIKKYHHISTLFIFVITQQKLPLQVLFNFSTSYKISNASSISLFKKLMTRTKTINDQTTSYLNFSPYRISLRKEYCTRTNVNIEELIMQKCTVQIFELHVDKYDLHPAALYDQ